MFTNMAARPLVLVVAIAFSPSYCTASYDEYHHDAMVEGSHLSLLQTAMQERGTQANAKQRDPGRDLCSVDSGATCMMMCDGGCTEFWSSFADTSSASSFSSMTAAADADASMDADDVVTDLEKRPSSKLLSVGLIVNALTFLVLLDMLRLWYVKRSCDNFEDDGVSVPGAHVFDAVEDNEVTPLMEPFTSSSSSSSLFHLAAGNANVSVVEMVLKQGAEVDERDAHGETPLHTAARVGADDVCKLLLDQGAAMNATNVIGWTPLGVAALAGKHTTCDLLLARGANAGDAAMMPESPLLERCMREQADSHRTASGDSADVPADPAPARDGTMESLIAFVSMYDGDGVITMNANEDLPDDSKDVFENGWDGWTWNEADDTTAGVA